MLLHGRDLTHLEFWRVCRDDLTHNGFVWQEGVNVDPLDFNPEGACRKGGLYFTTLDKVFDYLKTDRDIAEQLLGRISLDDDEPVWQECWKWKAKRVRWHSVLPLKTILQHPDRHHDVVMKLLEYMENALDYIPEPTMDMYKISLKYLKNFRRVPEELVNLEMVAKAFAEHRNEPLSWIPERFLNADMFLVAYKFCNIWLGLVPVEFRSKEVCREALMLDVDSNFDDVPQENLDDELCDMMTNEEPWSLSKCPHDYIVKRLRKNGLLLSRIAPEKRTMEMILTAVQQNHKAIQYVSRLMQERLKDVVQIRHRRSRNTKEKRKKYRIRRRNKRIQECNRLRDLLMMKSKQKQEQMDTS